MRVSNRVTTLSIATRFRKSAKPRWASRCQNRESYQTIFGNRDPEQVSVYELLGIDGGGSRLMSPIFPSVDISEDRSQLPMLIYIPGLDGTGLGAQKQLEYLSKGFQLEMFMVPITDKHTFEELLHDLNTYLVEMVAQVARDRVVYIMGESFGALLAMAAAHQCKDIIDRLIVINPATGYPSSFWFNVAPLITSAPKQTYPFLSGIIAPLLINPFSFLFKTDSAAIPPPAQLLQRGREMLGTLQFVSDNLNEDVVKWKLEVVSQGIAFVDDILHLIPQRTLVIASENDLLLPSAEEAERLKKLMLRAFVKILPQRSHAFMEDSDVDLVQILKDEGFYLIKRNMSSPVKFDKNGHPFLNGFGKAAPIELPSKEELQNLDSVIEQSRTLSSPIYLSTLSDGSIVEGLEGIPEAKPLIIVGNHTLMALDMSLLVHQLLTQKGILPRGLAHPVVMNDKINRVKKSPDDEDFGIFGDIIISLFNPRDAHKLYTLFGAVPVSAQNMYRLLALGECVLLYPGGAVEALKRRDEKYQIVWPDRSEFVRMGAKFGATVVTVASVGSEDGLYQVMDVNDMLSNPAIKDNMRKLGDSTPNARTGLSASEEKMQDTIVAPPFTIPTRPSRQYFLFGEPVQLTPDLVKDKKKAMDVYHQFKLELETNISYLIEKREEDPYREFEVRMLYETLNQKQAPTFNHKPFLNGSSS